VSDESVRRRSWFRWASILLPLTACKQEAAPPPPPPPPQVTVAPVALAEIVDHGKFTGWLDSARTVEVRSRVRGHLHKVHFQDGQLVPAGALLFELDPRPFEADIARAEAIVVALQAQADATGKEKARQESLLGRGGASQSLVDKLIADVVALGAQVQAQKQEVARLRLEHEYSRITAPIAGRIGRALLTEGNLVNAGGSDPLLATIVSVDPIYLFFTVDERALQQYQRRRQADGEGAGARQPIAFEFALDTDDGYPRHGVLDFADVKIDPGTGTISLRGTVPNPNGELVPGSRARVRIVLGKPRQSPVVPDRAILADQDRRYVLLVGDRNVVERRDVRLGNLLEDGRREVHPRGAGAEALTANDRVIVSGLLRARIGQPVTPAVEQ
jgi:RND family efflux transporter MFP subunit